MPLKTVNKKANARGPGSSEVEADRFDPGLAGGVSWSGGVDLAQAMNAVLQWLVVNLPPDEFSRQTFLVLDDTSAQGMVDRD